MTGIALQDFTEGNGATKIFPYSHTYKEEPNDLRAGTDFALTSTDTDGSGFYPLANLVAERWVKEQGKAAPIRAVMPAGSVVVWAGGVWHAGGAYTDAAGPDRAAVLFNWCRGVLRTQEDSKVQLPHGAVARMPVDCQRVLGYAMAGTGLGHANGAPPALLLGEGGKELIKWQVKAGKDMQIVQAYKDKARKAK